MAARRELLDDIHASGGACARLIVGISGIGFVGEISCVTAITRMNGNRVVFERGDLRHPVLDSGCVVDVIEDNDDGHSHFGRIIDRNGQAGQKR